MSIGIPLSKLAEAFRTKHKRQIKQRHSPCQMQFQVQNHQNDILGIREISNNSYEYQECPNLDMDATYEILGRLPVPSLMRAKTVCKNWKRAISATTLSLLSVEDDHLFVMQQMVHGFQGIAFFSTALNRWFRIPLFRQKKWGWYHHFHTMQNHVDQENKSFFDNPNLC